MWLWSAWESVWTSPLGATSSPGKFGKQCLYRIKYKLLSLVNKDLLQTAPTCLTSHLSSQAASLTNGSYQPGCCPEHTMLFPHFWASAPASPSAPLNILPCWPVNTHWRPLICLLKPPQFCGAFHRYFRYFTSSAPHLKYSINWIVAMDIVATCIYLFTFLLLKSMKRNWYHILGVMCILSI